MVMINIEGEESSLLSKLKCNHKLKLVNNRL
jgi:hypothetical protein